MAGLNAITASGTEIVNEILPGGELRPVVHVSDPNALTQVLGHVKFSLAASRSNVLYRGQSKLYDNLLSTGLRGATPKVRTILGADLRQYIAEISGGPCPAGANGRRLCRGLMNCQHRVKYDNKKNARAIASGTYRGAIEPLLQHYGLKSRWLDVVDNVWVALWFGCHKLEVADGRWAHHERRSVAEEPGGFAYIVCLDTGRPDLSKPIFPGGYVSDKANVVDLRYATPSIYIRPHAQHGLLISPLDFGEGADEGNLQHLELATVRIHLRDALSWLGAGSMLSTFALFPPATRDHGYRRLLAYAGQPPKALGEIIEYGPSS